MFNFRDIAELFRKNQACVLVRNEQELKKGIIELLNNPSGAENLGKKARDLVSQYKGATGKNTGFVRNILGGI
ncbi:MAG: hypothetical protein NTW64_06715 [Candidatus Omnitrophica bacterium]|nr:hypothetical protein [Candidatus Omnitrophota bacterium]